MDFIEILFDWIGLNQKLTGNAAIMSTITFEFRVCVCVCVHVRTYICTYMQEISN